MAIELSNVSNALKLVIAPFIQDNFPKQTILLDQVKRNDGVEFMNDNFYTAIRTSRHGGVTNLADDGNSLVSSRASIGRANVTPKIVTGTFDITKMTLDATRTSKGAVENQLTFQAETLMNDVARSVNRQYYSDGVGVVAEVATSGSVGVGTIAVQTPTSSLDDGRSIDWHGTVNGDIAPAKYLAPGNIIGIGTAAADLGTITSISGNTLIVTGAPAVNNNDAIYVVDGDGEGAGTAEIQGMRAALSTTTGTSTYAGVARSTVGWTPQLGTAAEALTLQAMEDVYLSAKEYAQMSDRYAIFANKSLYKKYGDILTSMRRVVSETQLLGGWSGLEFAAGAGRVGVFLDYDVPDGEVLVVNLDSWTVCQVSDMNWMEDPNSGSLVRARNNLTYQATMAWFTNLICRAPAANGRLTQKTD